MTLEIKTASKLTKHHFWKFQNLLRTEMSNFIIENNLGEDEVLFAKRFLFDREDVVILHDVYKQTLDYVRVRESQAAAREALAEIE